MPLTRNQKIGIAAAGSAAAVGLGAALVYVARRPPQCAIGTTYSKTTGRCEQIVITGYPSGPQTGVGSDPLTQAKRRLCTYPNGLTLEQRGLLEREVFLPLVDAAGGTDWSLVAEIDAGLEVVANLALADICISTPRPRARQAALQLARSAWWALTGQTGQ